MLDVQIDAGPHFFLYPNCMKYLFIDESLDEKVFVVGGVLVDSERDLLIAYTQLKKQILSIPMTRKQKEKVTYEFKSTLLERTYPNIKRKLLYKLNNLNCQVIFSSRELNCRLNQDVKERIYIELLSNIVNYIKEEIIIITFDSFGDAKFENKIIDEVGKLENVYSISKDFSFNSKGLQFADNVCGVIRKKISRNDVDDYYSIIKTKIIET